MTWTEHGKWTCPHPNCGQTVVVDGSDDDTAAAIAACQTRHGEVHREAAILAVRLRRKAS